MPAGLSSSGFTTKTLPEILDSLNEKTKNKFGDANTRPDSVFGNFNGIISEALAEIWENMQKIYSSQYPSSAMGISLDSLVELNNIQRLPATPSSVNIVLEADEGTVVPAGTQFKQLETNNSFLLLEEVTVSETSVVKAGISVDDLGVTPHSITINSSTVSNNITSSIANVLTDLRDQINTAGLFYAFIVGETLFIQNLSISTHTPFEVSVNATMLIDQRWSPGIAESTVVGPLLIPANSVTTIGTPVAGLNSVDNLIAGIKGSDAETDDALRLRRKLNIRVVGAGTVPAIESRLINEVAEITSVKVKENREDVADADGRPPHSIEVIVAFTPDSPENRIKIAEKIWQVKPAGIQTFGDISETIYDSSGDAQQIYFSVPESVYIHINCVIQLHPSTPFPLNGITLIKENLYSFGLSLPISEDVIRQRFFNSVYEISGVNDIITFELAGTDAPEDIPVFEEANVLIPSNKTAFFDLSLITVTID